MPAPKGNKYAKGNKGGGRPSFYSNALLPVVKKVLELGGTDVDLAEALEVSETTINDWKKKHKEFSAALKKAKIFADAQVERSLFERACGYTTTETKFATHQGLITDRVEYIKHYPPDTTACIFWLKNRQPDKWRDKQVMDMSILDPAERLKRAKARHKEATRRSQQP